MKHTTFKKARSHRSSTRAATLGACMLLAIAGCDYDEPEVPGEADADAPVVTGDADDRGMAPPTDRGMGEPTAAGDRAATVPAGTTMTFVVDETISTDDNDVGDQFTATLQSAVTGSQGNTLIETGTPSRWVVQQASTEGDSTVLAAQLESVEIDGEWQEIPAEVVSADVESEAGATGTETAAKIGVGTAAGAIIGQVLGEDTRGALTGAGVGAAVGAVVALATEGGSARLPAGSTLTVELTEPVTVTP